MTVCTNCFVICHTPLPHNSPTCNVVPHTLQNKLQVLTLTAITSLIYEVGIWLTVFTVDWQIRQSIVLSLHSLAQTAYMKVILMKKWRRFCLHLPHRKQPHVTRKPLGLQK